MVTGTFHDPRTGAQFNAEIQSGSYNVSTPSNDVMNVITAPNDMHSHCICPICSKNFDINLRAGADFGFRAWMDLADYRNSMYAAAVF